MKPGRQDVSSQLVAVDVIFEDGLLHPVADQRAEGADAVALLVRLQLLRGYGGETLMAETTHQRLLQNRNRDATLESGNDIESGLCFKSASKINCKQTSGPQASG